ncbi:MAG: MoaD/ThiS family protein [Microbacterium sp.]|uniref:Molybdopterin synthase sulfur carrier subunit n=1 Tax=Microbacterium ginsengisoli TaxID=400772 RepID=A0A0F0LU69_9MICO|nr:MULTISPECIES: MoaD/ThiS family protein [Microbacterium]MAL06803.1 MoaD/ThiS family protein [Microbacterium sp.]MCK9915421.1 MoaD/ThiS family protein [Microbacteriaceae bacterium K1510]KJL36817.1 ThiS family protein [Microbacterium ginsengisoli]KQR94126.1 molybdopterin synthase sulfur carrier subunit [Microbacterium sp. Leaf347]KQR97042.1 molybdopterin synthase sulfur carrier subunit [Microbacterium sp. Leaf351]
MSVTVRYFAAAEEIAGTPAEQRGAATVGELRAQLLAAHPGFDGVLPRCALLVDGARVDDEHLLTGSETIDVLPPFAGG